MPTKPRMQASEPQTDSHGQMLPELQDALRDKAAGMSNHALIRKHHVSEARLKAAFRSPQGKALMARIKREMRLPERPGKEEVLYKIHKWIEREEVKPEAKLTELVSAAMAYARLAGYLDAPKVTVNQSNVVAVGEVTFDAIRQRIAQLKEQQAICENSASACIDV